MLEKFDTNAVPALSSGFQAAVTTRVRSPLANPSILNVSFGNSTELVLKVTPIAHAKCYEVRAATVCADNTPGPWLAAGMFTNSRSMTIDGLTPGTTYMFQVRAIGGSTVTAHIATSDRKTGREVNGAELGNLSGYARPGTNTIALAVSIPVLPPGSYRTELKAMSAGNASVVRSVDFEVR